MASALTPDHAGAMTENPTQSVPPTEHVLPRRQLRPAAQQRLPTRHRRPLVRRRLHRPGPALRRRPGAHPRRGGRARVPRRHRPDRLRHPLAAPARPAAATSSPSVPCARATPARSPCSCSPRSSCSVGCSRSATATAGSPPVADPGRRRRAGSCWPGATRHAADRLRQRAGPALRHPPAPTARPRHPRRSATPPPSGEAMSTTRPLRRAADGERADPDARAAVCRQPAGRLPRPRSPAPTVARRAAGQPGPYGGRPTPPAPPRPVGPGPAAAARGAAAPARSSAWCRSASPWSGIGLGAALDDPLGFPGSSATLGFLIALTGVSVVVLTLGLRGRASGFSGFLVVVPRPAAGRRLGRLPRRGAGRRR